ncbi:hypothetical protein B566_EDAN002208 [Ephemera danica]|nr:hypothetical protein B566_EDAN002208 [Ephemera danica]
MFKSGCYLCKIKKYEILLATTKFQAMAAPQKGKLGMTKPMPMETRLCYFDFSGLGEPCRFMLAYGDEKFFDDRLTKEQFAERKKTFPFQKMPYLEIDDMCLHQSMAICRYLARKYGIAGNTEAQNVEADMMAETINDVRGVLAMYYWESEADVKERKKESILKQVDDYLERLEKRVVENGGFLVKSQLTYADVIFGSLAGYMCHMAGSDLFENRPALRGLKNKVLELPNIKKQNMAAPKGKLGMTKPMAMETRFCYFDFTGLGEPCRFMLAYGDEKFVDDRMTGEQFAERKKTFPFLKVPYLEIDDMCLHQTMAICRYLARKYGIAGKTEAQIVEADMMAETLNDVRSGLAMYHYESDAAAKERKKENTFKQTNEYLDRLEKRVAENGGNFVKGQLTWTDVIFAAFTHYLNFMAGYDLFENRPALLGLKDKVYALPNIKKYLDSRPAAKI